MTHFVVQVGGVEAPRLVPMSAVVGVDAHVLQLNCDKKQVADFPPFVEQEYVETDMTEYWSMADSQYMGVPSTIPSMAPQMVPIEHENIPEGELAVRHGVTVEATDGPVGQLDHLLANSTTGEVTHLVLQEGHLKGKRQIVLPLMAMARLEEEVLYLRLSKAQIELLPAVPLEGDGGEHIDMVGFVFKDPARATQELETAQQLHRQNVFKLINAAILIKDAAGKVEVKDTGDWSTGKSSAKGALVGGLVGLLGGPAGRRVGCAGRRGRWRRCCTQGPRLLQ